MTYVHVLMKDIQSLMFPLRFLSGVWNNRRGNIECLWLNEVIQMVCQGSSKNSACWLLRALRADGAAALPRPRFLSSHLLFSPPAVKDDNRKECRRYRHGPHGNLQPSDQQIIWQWKQKPSYHGQQWKSYLRWWAELIRNWNLIHFRLGVRIES